MPESSQEITEQVVKKGRGISAWLRILKNKYFLVTVFFIGWMLFFDNNNWFYLNRLTEEVERERNEKRWYENDITESGRQIDELTNDIKAVEKFGREQYYMKAQGEDVYLFLEE